MVIPTHAVVKYVGIDEAVFFIDETIASPKDDAIFVANACMATIAVGALILIPRTYPEIASMPSPIYTFDGLLLSCVSFRVSIPSSPANFAASSIA